MGAHKQCSLQSEWWTAKRLFARCRNDILWWRLFLALACGYADWRKKRNAELALVRYRRQGFEERFRWEGPARLEKALRRVDRTIARRRADLLQAAQSIARKHNSRVRAKLVRTLRRRFENAVRSTKHKSAWVRFYAGIGIDGLRAHLESRFKPGMTWANHSYTGWHLDHIKPLAKFDLTDIDQRRKAFHYTNLQPLWAKENLAKRDKIAEPT